MQEKKTFSVGKTFLLGFGFFGVSIIWSVYNMYVPILLKETFHLKSIIIGFIMTIDNIFAILLLPYLGALSDRTRTKLGKRRPYILFGAPLGALFFILIPFLNRYQILGLMMMVIILMNIAMATFRSPIIALMPDITPSKFRSQGNGIINFMGGLGSLLVFFGGKPLYDNNPAYLFFAGGVLMFFTSMLVVIVIREKDTTSNTTAAAETPIAAGKMTIRQSIGELAANLREVVIGDAAGGAGHEKSLLLILLAILCWFIGYNSIETFFSSFAKYYLGMEESTGGLILGYFSFTFMITAIAAGLIGSKLKRKITIGIGLGILAIIMVLSLFIRSFGLLSLVFVAGGFGWALVNVNSLPMVVDMTVMGKIGGFTGLYYFFSQAANIIAPPLSGFFIDIFGYRSLPVFAAFFFICSIFILVFIKRGEAHEEN